MAAVAHTYAPNCLLHANQNDFIKRATQTSTQAPPIKAQFFYCANSSIDDPLAPVPPPPSGPSARSVKLPPRPFSIHDNAALEDAWTQIKEARNKTASRKPVGKGKSHKQSSRKHDSAERTEGSGDQYTEGRRAADPGESFGRSATLSDSSGSGLQHNFRRSEEERRESRRSEQVTPLSRELADDTRRSTPSTRTQDVSGDEVDGTPHKRRHRSPFGRKDPPTQSQSLDERESSRPLSGRSDGPSPHFGSSLGERDTSGTPFLRIPSRLRRSCSRSRSRPHSPEKSEDIPQVDGFTTTKTKSLKVPAPSFRRFHSSRSESRSAASDSDYEDKSSGSPGNSNSGESLVIVGASRLHIVETLSLQMSPIYWDPVNDISSVVRGTWFYKDTMYPVEAGVANQIEAGYEYIKPWSQSYVDELNVCEEIGPVAELRLVYRLWPQASEGNRPSSRGASKTVREMAPEKYPTMPSDKASEAPLLGSILSTAAGTLEGFESQGRLYNKCSMIYANAGEAQILRPNQLPSVSRGRRPLANIRRSRAVGIQVVRGFDQRGWERLHPPSRKIVISQKAQSAAATFPAGAVQTPLLPPCEACTKPEDRPKPTDLVLVIHGIGQKLSERVESYHFTHAINAFRRQVYMELEIESVKPWLRKEMGTVMVLPVNWRSKIKEDDGGLDLQPSQEDGNPTNNYYTLKDITADSIPAIRNLMSDVLIDIPLYLSQHKPKLLQAVASEANRVYRLWCSHNPGFQSSGRVHVMAHSLGSVMTLDILSKQPTRVFKELDHPIRNDVFEFDTKNLFFLGSPAGLFLFINHAPLIPRKGRGKPGADGEDLGSKVGGEAGTYGCLAVDNLYNVMHYIDPIAYQLNACVDVRYAASLQKAFVPSTAITWSQYFGLSTNKALAPNRVLTGLESFPTRPLMQTLPSAVELETHNFSLEELAEKRMYLLNDNGQIDFTISSQGGPLEMQYLSMLSAHSSYWASQDFVRFLVVEIGRKPGKTETVLSMKATKKKRGKK